MKLKGAHYKPKQFGFTLIEVAVVLTVAGLIIAAAARGYNTYVDYQRTVKNADKMNSITQVIRKYASNSPTGLEHILCPADATLSRDDPNFGIADCSISGSAAGTCTVSGGICVVDGARDANDDGDLTNDTVMIGALPIITYRDALITAQDALVSEWEAQIANFILSGDTDAANQLRAQGPQRLIDFNDATTEDAIDMWGNQFLYAVTTSMTNGATYDTTHGAINVQNTAGNPVSSPANGVHYVVISHGENGSGARTADGVLYLPCDTSIMDGENCDWADATFTSAVRSAATGATYYDDHIRYASFTASEIWTNSLGSDDTFTNNVQSVVIGNLGAGTIQGRLHVTGNLRAHEMNADLYCNEAGTVCLDLDKIMGTGSQCPAAADPANNMMVAQEIVAGDVVCAEVPKPTANINDSCPLNEFLVGFNTDGTYICEAF